MAETTHIANAYLSGQVLLVDKPEEWTSFDVVNKIRGTIKRCANIRKIKVGHGGTLDPLATGLLVVCTGKATKTIAEIVEGEKEYIATIQLGGITPSYDRETAVSETFDTAHITLEQIKSVLRLFEGEIEQTPPLYSAVKVQGKRAYEYARKAQDLQLNARTVCVRSIELLSFADDKLQVRVICSKGTYIRTLAYDIGRSLHSGAYLYSLRRIRIGQCHVSNALTPNQIVNNIQHEII